MSKFLLEVEASNATGPFASSLMVYGYLSENPKIVEKEVRSESELEKYTKYLDSQGLPYKVNGKPFNRPSW